MRVTIITVCLNNRLFIEAAIKSVLKQDYPDFEYLIIDGESSDGTVEVIKAFAEIDARVLWSSAPDRGIGHAMNIGLGRATGDIIAFLHADDFYPDKGVVTAVVEKFETTPGTVWVTGGIREVDASGRDIRLLPVRLFSPRRLLRNNIIYHPATFVRREYLLNVGGFDESLRYAMDYDLWLRLTALSPPLEIEQTLACFRIHAGSISSVNRLAALDEEYHVRKRYLRGRLALYTHACYQMLRRAYESWRAVRA
ncbi:MAG: glycosyltransferase family 2 protein [Geobacteraceae bacterium]|jgi:glycosyltransferase involved in cell wall biosynthesis